MRVGSRVVADDVKVADGCKTARAAPRSPTRSLTTTRTGIVSNKGRMRPFATNARRNDGRFSQSRIFGAIPPAIYTPPTAIIFNARLPASAPYNDTNSSRHHTSAAMQRHERAVIERADAIPYGFDVIHQ
jgi:hypothetical protein